MPIPHKPLPFPSDALEPHIDKQTMEIHHGKHYKAYVDNYNKAVAEKAPQLEGKPLHEVLAKNLAIVPEDVKTVVRNNGGGAHNHALFWEILGPAGKGGRTGCASDSSRTTCTISGHFPSACCSRRLSSTDSRGRNDDSTNCFTSSGNSARRFGFGSGSSGV